MGYKAMLSVDLEEGVTSERRKIFNAEMEKRKWIKIPELTTTWRASFKGDVSEEDAILTTKSDVAQAADEAEVTTYHAAVHIGEDQPTEFSR